MKITKAIERMLIQNGLQFFTFMILAGMYFLLFHFGGFLIDVDGWDTWNVHHNLWFKCWFLWHSHPTHLQFRTVTQPKTQQEYMGKQVSERERQQTWHVENSDVECAVYNRKLIKTHRNNDANNFAIYIHLIFALDIIREHLVLWWTVFFLVALSYCANGAWVSGDK